MNRVNSMNGRIRRLALVAGSAAILLAAVGAAPASAATRPTGGVAAAAAEARGSRCAPLWVTATAAPTVANWKAVGLCEIDRRLETLSVLGSVVDNASVLTDAHEAALEKILADTASGLRALRAEIDGDTTIEALREDIKRIAEDFRVYLLVARQVHLVVATDAVEATADRFGPAIESLEAAIDAAEAAGRDIGDARGLLAGLVDDVEAADSGVDGVAADVLALTPDDWNDGSAQPVLRAGREKVTTARKHLREALAASKQIIVEIR